jgi:hypothetical protein
MMFDVVVRDATASVNLFHDARLLANNGRVIVIGNRGEITTNPHELMARRASSRVMPSRQSRRSAGVLPRRAASFAKKKRAQPVAGQSCAPVHQSADEP